MYRFEDADVTGGGRNRDAEADDSLQQQRCFERDTEPECAKADREGRSVLEPEHERPPQHTGEAPRTLEYREAFHDPIRGPHDAIGQAARQQASRYPFDQREKWSRPVGHKQRDPKHHAKQRRRGCGDRRERFSTPAVRRKRRHRDRHSHQAQHDERIEQPLHADRSERRREAHRQLP